MNLPLLDMMGMVKGSVLANGHYHIEAETKWPPFSRQHFQMHFLEWKYVNFYWDFTEVCSQGSIQQYSSIGSDNGFAPTRRQAIIWTNVGMLHICGELGELTTSGRKSGWTFHINTLCQEMKSFEEDELHLEITEIYLDLLYKLNKTSWWSN